MATTSGFLEYLPLLLQEEKLEEFDGDDSTVTIPTVEALQLFQLCRVCAQTSNSMVPIFSKGGSQMKLAEKIQEHLPINVQTSDLLPLQLCINCVLRLDAFHNLSKICATANQKLHSYLMETQGYDIESSVNSLKDVIEIDTENVDDNELSVKDTDVEMHKKQQIPAAKKEAVKPLKSKRIVHVPQLLCSICTKIIKGNKNLKSHCLSQHQKYLCLQCGKLFDSVEKELEHKEVHHMLECWCCGLFFLTQLQLVDHFRVEHNGLKPFQCKECDQCFSLMVYLLNHQAKHTQKKNYACETCDKCFKTINTLKQHTATHLTYSEKNSKLCSVCGKSYRTECKLKYHMRRHTGEMPYACEICHKSFHALQNYKLHKIVHIKKRNFSCDLCNVSYYHYRNLDKHKKTVHVNSWEFKCGVCETIFQSEEIVKYHYNNHTEIEINSKKCQDVFTKVSNFKCVECNKYFMNKFRLKDHIRCVHTNSRKVYKYFDEVPGMNFKIPADKETQLMCEVCGKNLPHKTALIAHLRIHMPVRPFICQYCSKGYLNKLFLEDHIRTHTGETPFDCDICGKKFHRKANRNKHRKAVHLNYRPHTCKVCNKRFKTNSNLRMHNRIHTGEKPYVCDVCQRAFTQKPDMQRHRLRHDFNEVCSAERLKTRDLKTSTVCSISNFEVTPMIQHGTATVVKSKLTSELPNKSCEETKAEVLDHKDSQYFSHENLSIFLSGENVIYSGTGNEIKTYNIL